MIYDRPYMRDDYESRDKSALVWIIAALIAGFVIQNIFEVANFGARADVTRLFGLTLSGMMEGRVWTVFSYGFLHANLLHIIANLLAVFFIGRELQPLTGNQRLLGLFGAGIVIGGVLWLAVQVALHFGANQPLSPAPLVGASAACFALLTAFACFFADRRITVLLFFLLPVTIRPRILLYWLLGISAFCFLFFELPGTSNTAHSAHLGGMLTGWLYFRFVHFRVPELRRPRAAIELPAWLRKRRTASTAKPTYTVNVARPEDLRAEVDRILDKINSNGFGSLTEQERRVLDEARESLNKR